MSDALAQVLALLARLMEIAGAATLVLGFVFATVACLSKVRSLEAAVAIAAYRLSLGRAVILGLEILVAATIINMITAERSAESMGLLATMIAIRTILGWTTTLEISGRWPWQKPPSETAS